jgi:hypothetical protein
LILETVDGQLDFNLFSVKNPEISSFEWEIVQSREVVQRSLFNDPIKKAHYVFTDRVNYSIALRKSGAIDLYWNM